VSDSSSLLISAAILVYILLRQLSPRPVCEERPYTLMAALAALGVFETSSFAHHHHVRPDAWAIWAGSLVLAVAFGAARGAQVHVWRNDGVLTRQGNAITVVLWIVGLGVHLGADKLIGATDSTANGLGYASLLLYFGIALAAQRFVTLRRAEHLEQAAQA
jgi:hypothetical protein